MDRNQNKKRCVHIRGDVRFFRSIVGSVSNICPPRNIDNHNNAINSCMALRQHDTACATFRSYSCHTRLQVGNQTSQAVYHAGRFFFRLFPNRVCVFYFFTFQGELCP